MKFTLTYPVKPVKINQKFGEVAYVDYYQNAGVNVVGHNGIDFQATHGQSIYASHDGMAWYEIDDKQGHGVVIGTQEQYDYGNAQAYFKSLYWHMCDSSKEPQFRSPVESYMDTTKDGLLVKRGDLIGYADSTGLSTGDHVHWGLKPALLRYPNDYTNIEQNNGYYGAIDPTPYIIDPLIAPIAPFNTNMYFGQTSDDIKRLQGILRRLGYFKYPTDTGFYGNMTQQAVLAFQKDKRIITFGIQSGFGSVFGPASRKVINTLL